MEKLQGFMIVSLAFTVVLSVLAIISTLLMRSSATISPDLLGAIIGYLFADLKLVLAYVFYRSESRSSDSEG